MPEWLTAIAVDLPAVARKRWQIVCLVVVETSIVEVHVKVHNVALSAAAKAVPRVVANIGARILITMDALVGCPKM